MQVLGCILFPALVVGVAASCVVGDSSCPADADMTADAAKMYSDHLGLVQRQASMIHTEDPKDADDEGDTESLDADDEHYFNETELHKLDILPCQRSLCVSGTCHTWWNKCKGEKTAPGDCMCFSGLYANFTGEPDKYTCVKCPIDTYKTGGRKCRDVPCLDCPAGKSTNGKVGAYSCKAITLAPTPSPTLAPTPSPASASASGDPHLTNTRGERFDIFKSGQMEFLRVPYESVTKNANFTVLATIQGVSDSIEKCKEYRYITSLRFGGAWLGDQLLDVAMHEQQMVVLLGGVKVKPSLQPLPIGNMQLNMPNERQLHVGVGATWIDVSRDIQPLHFFLNMQARSLGSLGCRIGGLLGEDDHVGVSTPPSGCDRGLLQKPLTPRRVQASARMTP